MLEIPLHLIGQSDQLLKKEIIGKDFYYAFKSLWKTRNRIVHGYSVTNDEVDTAMRLGAALITKLKQLRRRTA